MQRKGRTRGYFAHERFGTRDGAEITDEIALNPTHFRDRTVEQILSTLVHEMVHLRQFHHGKPSRTGYHNKEWARMMAEVGLIASTTGEPGGKQVGQRVTHYTEAGGRFERACADLLRTGRSLSYVDLWDEQKARRKAESKTKYTCEGCALNAWAKPLSSAGVHGVRRAADGKRRLPGRPIGLGHEPSGSAG